jgi:hypothetical protein
LVACVGKAGYYAAKLLPPGSDGSHHSRIALRTRIDFMRRTAKMALDWKKWRSVDGSMLTGLPNARPW